MRARKWRKRVNDAGRALLGKPICNAAYRERQSRDVMAQIGWFDIAQDEWEAAQALLTNAIPLPAEARGKVRWLLCQFAHPYGGVFTALRIADALQRRGFQNVISIYDDPHFAWKRHMDAIVSAFPSLAGARFNSLATDEEPEPCEYAVATFWPSTRHLLALPSVQHKIYLIQDFEPAFYPAGTSYALAEMGYRMPFHRVCNTPGLQRFIDANYPQPGIESMSFTPAVDARYHRLARPLRKPIRVLFYARPSTPRNAFELALAFAKALKARYGDDVELVAAGEGGSMERGTLEWAGVVSYEALPDFYASFHVIVAFMLTKHPSYLPFEAMACGCAVIANANEANTWFLKDNENCVLAQPTIPSLMDAFSRATEPESYARITSGATRTIGARQWEDEMAGIAAFFTALRGRQDTEM